MGSLILSVGSNFGDRRQMVADALQWLSRKLDNFESSTIYETPCALNKGGAYMNAVACGSFTGDISELDQLLKNYELEKGRDEDCRKKGIVPVDIDIVVSDNKILKDWDYRQKFFTIGFSELEKNVD